MRTIISKIEQDLSVKVHKRSSVRGFICEVNISYIDPSTGITTRKTERTNILWDGSEASKNEAIKSSKIYENAKKIVRGETPEAQLKDPGLTMPELLTAWFEYQKNVSLPMQKITSSSLNTYKYQINQIKKYFVKHPVKVRCIDISHIEEYIITLKKEGKSNNYVRQKLHYLDFIFEFARKKKIIRENIIKDMDVIPPKEPKKERIALSPDQLKLLLERSKGTPSEPMIYIYTFIGVRFSEALALTWSAIDFDKGYIRIEKNIRDDAGLTDKLKSPNSYRYIALHPYLKAFLLRLQSEQAENKAFYGAEYHDKGLVFCKDTGEPLTRSGWRYRFDRLIKKNPDLPRITPGNLRISFNSLQRETVPDFIAAKNMGHTATINNIYYTKPNDAMADTAVLYVGDRILDTGNDNEVK